MDNSLLIGFGVIVTLFGLNFVDLQNQLDQPDSNKKIIAISYINQNNIKGTVTFTETDNNNLTVDININGLPANSKLGFHIHEAGDLTDGCTSTCSHLNPYKSVHGGRDSATRHVGDLGNIETNQFGACIMSFTDHMIKLRGYKQNIIGRSVVIHEKTDDLGLGKNEESLKTGNAGKRIACAVIGYSKNNFLTKPNL